MSTSLALLAYAVAIAVGAPRLWGGWASRAPRLALGVLSALALGLLLATSLAGIALAVPVAVFSSGLSDLLGACVTAIRVAYSSPSSAVAATLGLALAAGVIVRAVACVAANVRVARLQRAQHARLLASVARPSALPDVSVVEAETVAAYCLPGQHRQIVLTSRALAALEPHQLAAVVAHEQAHLRGSHHLLVALAEGLERAFPWVPFFRFARQEVGGLVEYLADDAATRVEQRLTVAAALVVLAEAGAPRPALAAGGPGAMARVRRLLAPANPLHKGATALIAAAALLAVAAPAAAAAAPALQAARLDYCPVIFSEF